MKIIPVNRECFFITDSIPYSYIYIHTFLGLMDSLGFHGIALLPFLSHLMPHNSLSPIDYRVYHSHLGTLTPTHDTHSTCKVYYIYLWCHHWATVFFVSVVTYNCHNGQESLCKVVSGSRFELGTLWMSVKWSNLWAIEACVPSVENRMIGSSFFPPPNDIRQTRRHPP